MPMNLRYFPSAILLAINFALWAFTTDRIVGTTASYYLSLLLLAATFCLGHLKLFPFQSDRKLEPTFIATAVLLLLFAWPLACVNSLMKLGPLQFWYPTDHRLWATVPVFLIAGIAWHKGIRHL